ncbi:hypothetical protein O3G_MSEX013543 [Manduca sexta]|uniref:Uncharacterized protein n=1 Tax=Manduca sexta TaxID=7130 RepID=A0A921ZSC0_MANSE|nr:hypothetical protein O3G_MSEX013543 [Manduca sexta]
MTEANKLAVRLMASSFHHPWTLQCQRHSQAVAYQEVSTLKATFKGQVIALEEYRCRKFIRNSA